MDTSGNLNLGHDGKNQDMDMLNTAVPGSQASYFSCTQLLNYKIHTASHAP